MSASHLFALLSGLLHEHTFSALDLAQRARSVVTKASTARWNPRATEREIRDGIMDIRCAMSQGESEVNSIHRLAELTQYLQVKDQTSLIHHMLPFSVHSKKCLQSMICTTGSEKSVMGEEEGRVREDKSTNEGS